MTEPSRTAVAPSEHRPRVGLLFDYDWDVCAHEGLAPRFHYDRAGFGLF